MTSDYHMYRALRAFRKAGLDVQPRPIPDGRKRYSSWYKRWELAVDLEITAGRSNKARLNRSPVRAAREVLGVLRAVLFAPEDLALVQGDPGERRRYLDELAIVRRPTLRRPALHAHGLQPW